jgi:hypothetical protein
MSLVTRHSYYGHEPWQSWPSEEPYFQARDEHAWRLREMQIGIKEIAQRLGVARSSPRLMIFRHEVRKEMPL